MLTRKCACFGPGTRRLGRVEIKLEIEDAWGFLGVKELNKHTTWRAMRLPRTDHVRLAFSSIGTILNTRCLILKVLIIATFSNIEGLKWLLKSKNLTSVVLDF